LGRDARGTSVLVTFVRQSEIDECLKFASSAELELLGLSPGLEDLSRVCLLSLEGEPPSVYRIIHFGENTVNTLDFEGEHLIALETEHVSETLGAAEARLKGTTQNEDGTRKTFFSGRIPDQETGGIILRPFGLSSEFALAAGLALRGLMPNPHFADFLPPDEQAKSELRLSKSFFRRSATACCLFVLLLLGIPFGLASLIELRSDNLDARLAASGSSTREISELQKEAALLREVTLSTRTSALRSHAAFILHEIAAHTPEGVVLSQLTLSEAKSSITLKGTGKSQIDLSKFMKNLKTSPFCLDLSLTALNARSTLGVKPYTRSGSISFELSLTTRLGGGK